MTKSLLFLSAAGILFASSALAVTVNGTAVAVIKTAINASQTQGMDFGIIESKSTAGTVTVSAAGTRSSSTHTAYGTAKQSIFSISGDNNTSVNYSYTNSTLTNGSGGSMTLSNFTPAASSFTTDASGNYTLNVGADLGVGANQANGTYNGTYVLTLSY